MHGKLTRFFLIRKQAGEGAGHHGSDPVIRFVTETAHAFPSVRRVFLFGSRAKGDGTERSDYDFAFEIEPGHEDGWGELCARLREGNPRLNALDLARMDQIGKEFKKRILKEGVVVYDKTQAIPREPIKGFREP